MSSLVNYRPEIDGLRAIAVSSVLFFHGGFDVFAGGFLGVDIFFVISGFLITSILLKEFESGSFSLIDFYERRARRILPALFFVVGVSLPFAWWLLLPIEMKDFSQSLVATATFSSNILFFLESSYWDQSSELKPLLHTWSLAIEEQYYVLFPLILMLFWRFSRATVVIVIAVLSLISFYLAIQLNTLKPSEAFYMLHTRWWELCLGSLIACYRFYRPIRPLAEEASVTLFKNLVGLLGLAMIFLGILAYDDSKPTPGIYTLLPLLGVSIVILFVNSKSIAGKILGHKYVVGVGLISYSLYLWHQPLLAFGRHFVPKELEHSSSLLLILFSFGLAYLSWRFVEKPVRDRNKVSMRKIFIGSAVGSAMMISIGIAGHLSNGFEMRAFGDHDFSYFRDKLNVNYGLKSECGFEGERALCVTGKDPQVLVWGDSFAMHWFEGIREKLSDKHIVQITKSECGPFFDIAPATLDAGSVVWAKECLEHSQQVKRWIKNQTSLKHVIVSSPFSQYLRPSAQILTDKGDLTPYNPGDLAKEFWGTAQIFEKMGIAVTLVSSTPQDGHNIGLCLARAELHGRAKDQCNILVGNFSEDYYFARRFLKELVNLDTNIKVLDLEKALCDDYQCKTFEDDVFFYRDEGHISIEGSKKMFGLIGLDVN